MTESNRLKLSIVDRLHSLRDDELEVLLEVSIGLVNGRAVYGQLVIDTDPRDFEKELREENRDALVYAAIRAIQKRRAIGMFCVECAAPTVGTSWCGQCRRSA